MLDKDSFPARTSATNFAASPMPVFACGTDGFRKRIFHTEEAELKTRVH